VLLTGLFVGPFVWAILSSLKAPDEIILFPPRWLPRDPQWGNYFAVWQQVPFARFWWNSILVTALAVLGQVGSATLVAYGFARFRFPGRDILFMLVIATLVLPEEATLIPRFVLFRQLGWLDTFLPLIVPFYLGGSPFFIFLLRQFILALPREVEEAAEVDGAGSLRILWSIVLPAIRPALATATIFSFLSHWDDFLGPLIYLRSTENYTLALGLRFFQQSAETGGLPKEPLLMAASLMVAAPPILVVFVAQRYLIRGFVTPGARG
jgi:multiple sugar transport system permease protein